MISKKMQQYLISGKPFNAMFEDGLRLSKEFGAENIFDFSIGNPSVEPPVSVKKAINHILDTEAPNLIHGYTNPAGYPDVRKKIAESINEEFSTAYTEKNIIMTCSAAGGLNTVLKTILNPEDEVIVFAPYFGDYEPYVQNYDGKLVVLPANTDTFQPDAAILEQAITAKTKAVLINSPNNPSGVIYSRETLEQLSAVLKKKSEQLQSTIYLIADEPYRRLAFDGIEVPFVPDFYPNTFVCYSFSKAISLPGERIGYIIAPNTLEAFDTTISALATANRVTIINAPSLFQRVIPYCIEEKSDLSIYDKNRKYFYEMLTELGFTCAYPQGAFYLFPKSPISDEKEFCKAAQRQRLILVPGSAFGCPGYFRIAYCVPFEKIVASRESFAILAKKYLR